MQRTVRISVVISMLASVLLVGPLLTGPLRADAPTDQYATDQYTVAAGHYASHRWDLAATEFTTFLAEHPDHPWQDRAIFYHAEALVQMDRFDEARTQFQKLLAEHPQSEFAHRALFRSGEAAYLSGQPELAKADLERFNQQHSDDPLCGYALPYLAEIALAQEQTDVAERLFARALKQFPDGPLRDDCRLGIARAWQAQGRLDDALRAFERMVDDPECRSVDQAMYEIGRSHYHAGKLSEARTTWQQLEERFPESVWRLRADLGRGWISYREKKYDLAAESFQVLIGKEVPATIRVEAHYRLGMVRRAEKQWHEAAQLFTSAATIEPGHRRLPAIYYHAGDSYLMLEKADEATEQFDLALAEGPDTPWADDAVLGKIRAAAQRKDYEAMEAIARQFSDQFSDSLLRSKAELLRASALMALGRFQEAIEPLELFLTSSPADSQVANCRAELAICFAHLKQFDQAKAAYQDLIQNHPDHEVVLPTTQHLADLAFAAGNRIWSEALYQRVADAGSSAGTVADGLSGLAWSQLKSENLHASAATFERLMRRYPDDPRIAEAALARGQIFERLEKFEPALAMYQIVIDRHPLSPQFVAALFASARLHDRLQQDQLARELYERLMTKHPQFSDRDAVLYGWGWVLREQGELTESDQKFQQLHDEFTESKHWAEASYLLAERAADAKQYDKAQELLKEILDEPDGGPIVARGLYLRGRIALAREDWEAIEAPLSKLVREYPSSSLRLPALYWMAEAKFRSGDFDTAAERFETLAAQTQGHEEPWLAMVPLRQAQILARDKQWTKALEIASGIEKRFPDFNQQYEADYLTGRCHAALGQLSAAREAYLRVVRTSTHNKTETAAMAQWMIGETYMHQKMYERARREYLRTETLYAFPEWQARSLLQAGKCYELQGHWQQAVELYSELKVKYPNTNSVEEASRRLRVSQQRASNVR